MNQVTICENTFEPSTWEKFDVDDVRAFLTERFPAWPKGAHIYLDHVAENADITPYDQAGVERLGRTQGHFIVVVYPELEIALIIVAIVVAAVSIGLSFLLRPHPTTPNQQNSANNQLADRQNQARPNERIPDIYGQLWATFDLLTVPHTEFVNNFEYEHCYMCVGRGTYQFESINGVVQVRDDITPLAQIDGASAVAYGPGANPNNGGAGLLLAGTFFSEPVSNVQRFSGVNGQVLKAPNLNSSLGIAGLVRFLYGGQIENNVGVDFTDGFQPGDVLNIGGLLPNDALVTDPSGIEVPVDLSGVYVIAAVTSSVITLDNPFLVNHNWGALALFHGGAGDTTYGSYSFMANNTFWISDPLPFFLPYPTMTEVWANFICPQGLYQVGTDAKQVAVTDTVVLAWTPCDADGNATAAEVQNFFNVVGSAFDRQAKGTTAKVNVTPGPGGILLRARRYSNTNLSSSINVSDEVQWRDAYIVSDLGVIDFGDVTTVQTIIKATPDAVVVKNRKMNALVTRALQTPYSGGRVFPTVNAADIIYAMSIDPFIGNMDPSEINVMDIYAIAGNGGIIQNYFNMYPDPTLPTQFCYTFDDSTVSFEESLSDIATSIFCVGYRRGGILSLSFEQKTANSTLLFNHRNKIPKSETRTVTFGTSTDNDGIELDYIEPNAPNFPNLDTTVTLYFPTDQSATNPKKIKSIGIRNVQQATCLGWRLYWKLILQNTAVQFDCTEEAALLVQQDRILVADNTRSDTQDGEVVDQLILLLTLSQNVVFDSRYSYTIFLQSQDGSVESIPITAGTNQNQVLLGHAPKFPCVTDDNNFAKTTYMIVSNAPVRQTAMLVSEKTPKDIKTWEVKAVNYDDGYYQNDAGFSTNINIAGQYLEVFQPSPPPKMDVAGQYLETIQPVPLPFVDVAGMYIEVISVPPIVLSGDVAGQYLEAITKPASPNMDVAGEFLEVVATYTVPNADIAGQFLEAVGNFTAPKMDVAGMYLEVMVH